MSEAEVLAGVIEMAAYDLESLCLKEAHPVSLHGQFNLMSLQLHLQDTASLQAKLDSKGKGAYVLVDWRNRISLTLMHIYHSFPIFHFYGITRGTKLKLHSLGSGGLTSRNYFYRLEVQGEGMGMLGLFYSLYLAFRLLSSLCILLIFLCSHTCVFPCV